MITMIPNRFHFVYLTTKDNIHPMYQEFHLMHYLCIKSAMVVNSPDEINVYCNQEPSGEWWDKIKDDVNIVFVELPTEILIFVDASSSPIVPTFVISGELIFVIKLESA